MKLTSAPKLTASMKESPLYRVMGVGLTDTLFLLAHHGEWDEEAQDIKGKIKLNDPYPVSDMQTAVNDLGADVDSPLLMALMESYYSGARDIWLVAAAPIDEYEPDLEQRDQAYYQQYRDRLNQTYEILKDWDITQITVPVDAPFNSTVDFLSPFLSYLSESMHISGDVHLGVMGTRGIIDSEMVDALVSDGRLSESALEEAGKLVSVFVGDGTYNLKEMPLHHTSSVAVGAAAEMVQLPLDRGMTYTRLRNVINTVGPDLSKEDIQRLAEARLNYVGRDILGRRGRPMSVYSFSDNTLAQDGSDYWSMLQMRLVASVAHEIKTIGTNKLGTIGFDLFKNDVQDYLTGLASRNIIRSYDLYIRRDHVDRTRVLVDADLTPYFGVRTLHVNAVVGPGQ